MPSRENAPAAPRPPRRTGRPGRPCPGQVVHGERGVQPDPGHGDAEAVRADQAHAPAAAVASRPAHCGRGQPGGDHHQRLAPRWPHSSATPSTAAAGHRHHRQVGGLGQRGHRRRRRGCLDVAACGLTAYRAPAKPRVPDVEQDRPADDPGRWPAPTTATDRGASSGQAGHVGLLLPARHRVQVGASSLSPALRGIGMDSSTTPSSIAPARSAPRRRAPAACGVLAPASSGEGATPRGAGQRDQVLEQQRGDAAPVHAVGDRERDLRGLRVARGARSWPLPPARRQASSATWSGPVSRHTRRASCSAARRLVLKKRKYRLSGDIASCSLTAPSRPGPAGRMVVVPSASRAYALRVKAVDGALDGIHQARLFRPPCLGPVHRSRDGAGTGKWPLDGGASGP